MDARARLEQELTRLVGEVDDEGLLYLIDQAQTLVHNAGVERVNAAARELQGDTDAGAGRPTPAATPVTIDGSGGVYHLGLASGRYTLSAAGTKELVRRCYEPATKSAALTALHRWLAVERGDIVGSAGIDGPQHPAIEALFQALRATFQQ
jgi:hypothetical protein